MTYVTEHLRTGGPGCSSVLSVQLCLINDSEKNIMTHTGMVFFFCFKDMPLTLFLYFHDQDKTHNFSISFLDKRTTAESHIWINMREDSAGDGADK